MAVYLNRSRSDEETYLLLAGRPAPSHKSFSKYRGVTKGSKNYPYRVQVNYAGRRFYVGSFKTEDEAAAAYNSAVLTIIGPHAYLNEVPNNIENQ